MQGRVRFKTRTPAWMGRWMAARVARAAPAERTALALTLPRMWWGVVDGGAV